VGKRKKDERGGFTWLLIGVIALGTLGGAKHELPKLKISPGSGIAGSHGSSAQRVRDIESHTCQASNFDDAVVAFTDPRTYSNRNPRGLTAAHRRLPFNSEVVVRNLKNKRTVKVRIVDYGPAKRLNKRCIDLSLEAWNKLGGGGAGLIPVRLTVTEVGPYPWQTANL
jgi:rare lipoprotein A